MATGVRNFEALGTTITIEAEAETVDQALIIAIKEAERVEQKFSRFRSNSDLSKLNNNLNTWGTVDAEFLALLKQAQLLTSQTDGAFDIGVHQTLEHWGYDADYNLKAQAESKNFEALKLELKDSQVKINTPVDFGAFGKGYFLDGCARLFAAEKIAHYVLNAGGDLRCAAPQGLEAWTLFLEDPRCTDRAIGEMKIREGILCSSSPSRRQWGDFHHLVDTKLSQPAKKMSAVYVYHPTNGLLADALSTSLFVMGFDVAQTQYESLKALYPELAIMLISEKGVVWQSDNFTAQLYTAS